MSKKELLLVLANSQKNGGRCVAGKLLTPNGNGTYDVGRWVRLIHPDRREGEIPAEMTLIDDQWLAPFDVIEIGLDKAMRDSHHPEDWLIDPGTTWRRTFYISKGDLPQLCDDPVDLWGKDSAICRRVPVGYVSQMTVPATLRLVAATSPCAVRGFIEDRMDGRGPRVRVRLQIPHEGVIHEFDVKDLAFLARYGIEEIVRKYGRFELLLAVPSKVGFCLSLTPPFNDYQYKIAAAIIELS
ncbi:MAG: hypothetical protein WCP06_07375 [Verrucomicrobiota bacterium]